MLNLEKKEDEELKGGCAGSASRVLTGHLLQILEEI